MATILPEQSVGPALGTVDSGRRRRRRSIVGVSTAVVLCIALGLTWTFRRPLFHGNLGTVDPGRAFRSAQPTSQLNDWASRFHLRSVLNLRGGRSSDWWYAAEVNTTRDRGIAFYDLPLKATRRPTRRELLVLIDTLKNCPYPVLIHCKSGADRTGLASAVYLMVERGVPPERALRAFSIDYGHVPIGGPQHLHEPIEEYAAWLSERRLAHTPERFRDWVKNEYESTGDRSDPPPLRPGPRPWRSP